MAESVSLSDDEDGVAWEFRAVDEDSVAWEFRAVDEDSVAWKCHADDEMASLISKGSFD